MVSPCVGVRLVCVLWEYFGTTEDSLSHDAKTERLLMGYRAIDLVRNNKSYRWVWSSPWSLFSFLSPIAPDGSSQEYRYEQHNDIKAGGFIYSL